jgi:DNA adenine methylase
MSNRRFYTPLRYPGGKGKFAHFIKSIFEQNNFLDGHYVEPYAGGAGVALELLNLEYASHIHINDLDPAIFSFWEATVNFPEELCQLINDTPINMDVWKRQKEVLLNTERHSVLEIGFATLFLNRTNRSGILKAGVIGGKLQSGEWKMDVRFNKHELIKRILKIANYKNRIHIYNLDAVDLLTTVTPNLPDNSLIYLDPPYYVKGSGLYRNFYTHDDHVRIEKTLRDVDKPWIVSYDNVDEIKGIYSNYRQDEYFLSYTVQEKKQGSEVMIYGPSIEIPTRKIQKNTA